MVRFVYSETQREGVAWPEPRGRKESPRGLRSLQPPFLLWRNTGFLELQSKSAGVRACCRRVRIRLTPFDSGCSLPTTCFATDTSPLGLAHRSILSQADLARFQPVLRRDSSPMRLLSSRLACRKAASACPRTRLIDKTAFWRSPRPQQYFWLFLSSKPPALTDPMRHSPSRSYDSRRRSSSSSVSSSDDGYCPNRRTGRRWRREYSPGHGNLPSLPPRTHHGLDPSSFELQPLGGSRSTDPPEDVEAPHNADRNTGSNPTTGYNGRGATGSQRQPARRPLIRHVASRRATAGERARRCCPFLFIQYTKGQLAFIITVGVVVIVGIAIAIWQMGKVATFWN